MIAKTKAASEELAPGVRVAVAVIPAAAFCQRHQVKSGVPIGFAVQSSAQYAGGFSQGTNGQLAAAGATGFRATLPHIGDSGNLTVRADGQPGAARSQVSPGQQMLTAVGLPPVHGGRGTAEEFIPVGSNHKGKTGVLADGKGN